MEASALIFSIFGTVDLVLAVILAYYAIQNSLTFKGKRAQYVITAGTILFVGTGIVSAMGHLAFGARLVARYLTFAFFVTGTVLIIGGVSCSMVIIRRSIGKISWLKTARIFPSYKYLIGGSLVLTFLALPSHALALRIEAASVFGLAAQIFIMFGFVAILMGERKLYLAIRPTAAVSAATAAELHLLRDDIRVLTAYSRLTNGLLARIAPAIGPRAVQEIMARCAEDHPILLAAHKFERNGMLNTAALTGNLNKIHKTERTRELFSTFSDLNSGLLRFYESMTDPSRTAELVAMAIAERSEEVLWIEGVPLGEYIDVVYERGTFLGLPEGVADDGKARTVAHMLFKRVFEPLVKKCKKPTMERIRNRLRQGDLATAGVEMSDAGEIRLNTLYERLSEMVPPISEISSALRRKGERRVHAVLGDMLEKVRHTFTATWDACYPIIEEDIGAERARVTISDGFSRLFREHGAFLHRYGLAEVVPRDIEIPGVYRPLTTGSYLVEERIPEKAFKMFRDMVGYGLPGLCISTTHPADVKSRYEVPERATILWLSKTVAEYAIPPAHLGVIRDRISGFVSRNENAVVLLDGFEYLSTINGFDLALKFLHDVRESIALKRAVLIVPVNPAALEPKQLELLGRYITIIRTGPEARASS